MIMRYIGSFGYIFRLKDLKCENADIYSFVFSLLTDAWMKGIRTFSVQRYF